MVEIKKPKAVIPWNNKDFVQVEYKVGVYLEEGKRREREGMVCEGYADGRPNCKVQYQSYLLSL